MNEQKGFAQAWVLVIIVLLVIGAGVVWVVVDNNKSKEGVTGQNMEGKDSSAMDKSDDGMKGTDDSMSDEAESMDDVMMQKPGSYKEYSVSTVESEQKAGNQVVLFFHAPWCPYCKAANEAFVSRSSEIPAGVTVLKTDYDSSTELKQKYGVTYQHTFVQIDNDETLVSKWNGGDIDSLIKYLK